MNIKYVSLLSLLFVSGAKALTPAETMDIAYTRYASAHEALIKCQQLRNFWGKPYQCTSEKNDVEIKTDEYNKVMSKTKNFLTTTVQQGNEATIFQRSKKQKAKMAKQVLNTIATYEQEPKKGLDKYYGMGKFSGDLLWNPSNNTIDLPGDKEAVKQFNNDLFDTLPNYSAYPFISTY